MPIPLSKEDTFKLVLKSDENKPEPDRPWFKFNFLSGRQQKKLAELLDSFSESKKSLEVIVKSFDMIRPLIVGWGNLTDKTGKEISFDRDKLEDIMQFAEAQELAWKLFGFSVPDINELKNLESQSPMSMEKSANPENAESAKTQ